MTPQTREDNMRSRFFRIPVWDPAGPATDELNRFLASHTVATMDRELIHDGPNSCWAVCVSYVHGGDKSVESKKGRVDYREVLSAEDFDLYVKLRSWRNDTAENDGVRPFVIFSNEQLAEMARRRVTTVAGLREIAGVGAARIEKYGEGAVAVVSAHEAEQTASSDETSQDQS